MNINHEEVILNKEGESLTEVFNMSDEEGIALEERIHGAMKKFSNEHGGGMLGHMTTYMVNEVEPTTVQEVFMIGLIMGSSISERE